MVKTILRKRLKTASPALLQHGRNYPAIRGDWQHLRAIYAALSYPKYDYFMVHRSKRGRFPKPKGA